MTSLCSFPDNIQRSRGYDSPAHYWIGLVSLRLRSADRLSQYPSMRSTVMNTLPMWLQPQPRRYDHVFAINETGEVIVR